MDKEIMRFDIETCPEVTTEVEWATYPKRSCREKKAESNPEIDGTFRSYKKKAWLYPEFSRVVCVSFSCKWTVKTIIERDEKDLLLKINEIFTAWEWMLGGYNIYNFDIPYLRKRMVINGIVPAMKLSIADMKPREMWDNIIDVMQIWKQTSFTCSLDLLSLTLLGDSPKSDGAGDMVASAWCSENYDWIKNYCEWDVAFTIRCWKAIQNPTATRSEHFFEVHQKVIKRWNELPTEEHVEEAVEKLRENTVSDEQVKAFDEWIEQRMEESKSIAEAKMSEPIEEEPLPF